MHDISVLEIYGVGKGVDFRIEGTTKVLKTKLIDSKTGFVGIYISLRLLPTIFKQFLEDFIIVVCGTSWQILGL